MFDFQRTYPTSKYLYRLLLPHAPTPTSIPNPNSNPNPSPNPKPPFPLLLLPTDLQVCQSTPGYKFYEHDVGQTLNRACRHAVDVTSAAQICSATDGCTAFTWMNSRPGNNYCLIIYVPNKPHAIRSGAVSQISGTDRAGYALPCWGTYKAVAGVFVLKAELSGRHTHWRSLVVCVSWSTSSTTQIGALFFNNNNKFRHKPSQIVSAHSYDMIMNLTPKHEQEHCIVYTL